MRKLWIGLAVLLLAALLWFAGAQAPALAQATSTYTPTPTAAFILPLINVPIILPTAAMPPIPTEIVVHVTAAPNMNPYGLNVPANPVWAWQEGLNWMTGILKAMGWLGNILYFAFIATMALALMNRIRRALMGQDPVGKISYPHLKKSPKGK